MQVSWQRSGYYRLSCARTSVLPPFLLPRRMVLFATAMLKYGSAATTLSRTKQPNTLLVGLTYPSCGSEKSKVQDGPMVGYILPR